MDLLDLALTPLTIESVQRVRQRVIELGRGDGYVAHYCHQTRVCIGVLVADGEIVTWTQFPSRDEQAARDASELMHALAAEQLQQRRDALGRAASAVIERAKGDTH